MVFEQNIAPYVLEENCSVIEAMKQINSSGNKVVFVVKDKKLLASLNDGDVRRWILGSGDVNAPVSEMANYNPRFLTHGTVQEAKALIDRYNHDGIPNVNEEGELLSIFFRATGVKQQKPPLNLPVVIMAGGKGTRLYPYTQILPKALMPIGEKTITEHIMSQFMNFGCNEFHFIINHKKNMIKAYFNELEHPSFQVNFIEEKEFLGTGGGISLLNGHIDQCFILSNCDILITEDFHDIYQYHKEKKNKITMICAMKAFEIPYGVVHLEEEGKLHHIDEKPNFSFLTNTGCYLVEPEVICAVKQGEVIGFPDIIQRFQEQGECVGVYPVTEEAWMDMGQLEEMEKMTRMLGV